MPDSYLKKKALFACFSTALLSGDGARRCRLWGRWALLSQVPFPRSWNGTQRAVLVQRSLGDPSNPRLCELRASSEIQGDFAYQ